MILISKILPSTSNEESVRLIGCRHTYEYGGLVVFTALGYIELGCTDFVPAYPAAEIIVSAQCLLIIILRIYCEAVCFWQLPGYQFFFHGFLTLA